MFVRLGLTNSLKQLSRSLLVLVGMVLAAMSLTSALSFSEGEMRDSYQFYRGLLGGEILVSPVSWTGQSLTETGGRAVFNQLEVTGLSWLELFYPELYEQGYLAPSDTPQRQVFSEQEMAELRGFPGVAGVTVNPQLPSDLTSLALPYEHYSPFTVMPLPPEQMLRTGDEVKGLQPFSLSTYREADVPLVWINYFHDIPESLTAEAHGNTLAVEIASSQHDRVYTEEELGRIKKMLARAKATEEMKLPRAGERAELLLPRMRRDESGEYAPDYSDQIRIEVQIAGYVAMPTRSISWPHPLAIVLTEDAYLHASNLYVTSETWQQIWHQVSGQTDLPLHNVSLQVTDMSQLAPLMESLRDRFPQFTFVDVEQFAERMELTSRLDYFYRAPSFVYSPAQSASLAMPRELGPITGLLFFLIAGMLTMSRMLTGTAARRSEIGILKTLGARRRDIAVMALSEAVVTALIGSALGFLFIRLGGLAVEVSNNVPWSVILNRTLQEGALVVALASGTALLFALAPAIRLSNLTVMEVLRGE